MRLCDSRMCAPSRHRHARKRIDLVAPVKLVGFPRRKAHRHIGCSRRLPTLAWPIAWHNGARHRSHRHSRARVTPRRSGSASAAREQAWPRCRPGVRRVLLSIARASVGAERLVRTRGCCTRRSTLRTVFRDTFRSRAISLIVLPLMKCSRRIRPIVSTVSIPPTARLESKRAAHQANLKGVNFGRRSPRSGGQNCTPNNSVNPLGLSGSDENSCSAGFQPAYDRVELIRVAFELAQNTSVFHPTSDISLCRTNRRSGANNRHRFCSRFGLFQFVRAFSEQAWASPRMAVSSTGGQRSRQCLFICIMPP